MIKFSVKTHTHDLYLDGRDHLLRMNDAPLGYCDLYRARCVIGGENASDGGSDCFLHHVHALFLDLAVSRRDCVGADRHHLFGVANLDRGVPSHDPPVIK